MSSQADWEQIKANTRVDTSWNGPTWCYDCGRSYGVEHGFPDLVVPHDVWKKLSPTGDEGGLLCPSCLCKRADAAGVKCEAKFTSGPFTASAEDKAHA